MTETISATDKNLIQLEGEETFFKHTKKISSLTSRELCILTDELDRSIFNNQKIVDQLSAFVRQDRHSTIKILVKNIKPIIEHGHLLLTLSRKIPSKIIIKKLLFAPKDNAMAYMIGDKKYLLYKHSDNEYLGFVNYSAGPESQKLLEEFTYLWESHSIADPELRQLTI
ncbi:MAG: hypothetical protein ACRBCS_08570 [Cellvibrionaceae bacterium]